MTPMTEPRPDASDKVRAEYCETIATGVRFAEACLADAIEAHPNRPDMAITDHRERLRDLRGWLAELTR